MVSRKKASLFGALLAAMLLASCASGGVAPTVTAAPSSSVPVASTEATNLNEATSGKPCGDYLEKPDAEKPVEEIACNRAGVPVFSSPGGAPAPEEIPATIPFGEHVHIKCYRDSTAGMASVSKFYLIADGKWRNAYAPADTFWNGDRSFNKRVKECPN